ncbi:hypothetical protein AGABI1DRAFT_70128, partial [Agaricus bisporus var. burnettii JB137-S8]
MAFPIPSHLPRKQDVSSKILNTIDSATYRTLNSSLTSTWLNELDDTIQATKTRLHKCIHSDLPLFHRQLDSANSIQTRLQALTNNVDKLNDAVTDKQFGLVPVLLHGLSKHSNLVQEAADISIRHQVLSHIFRCKTELANVNALIASGNFPEAVAALELLHTLLESAPEALAHSDIFLSFRRKHQSTQALVQEQLSDAYTRSVTVSFSQLVLRSSIQVRGSDTFISLSSILSSLTPITLDQHLTTLRRDLLTHFIENVLKQPTSISVNDTSAAEHSMTVLPTPSPNSPKSGRIDNLSQILDFLSSHLLPVVPASVSSKFRQSLFKPVASSLLNILLIPSLPSSFGLLAPFLDLAKHAVTFESKAVTQLVGNTTADLPVRTWVNGLATHYEKQRRLELLNNCRVLVLSPEDSKDWFQFEIEIPSESAETKIVPVQSDVASESAVDDDFKDDAWGFEDEVEENSSQVASATEKVKVNDINDDAWGFDEEVEEEKMPSVEPSVTDEAVDDGWGFDDDVAIDEPEPVAEPKPEKYSSLPPTDKADMNGESEPDPGDAWGWNEDANTVEEKGEDNSWDDDPWGDSPATNTQDPVVSPPLSTPKSATRLEKRANKGKKPLNGHTNVDAAPAPVLLPPPSPPHSISSHAKTLPRKQTSVPTKRPPELKTSLVSRENFAVPEKAKRLVRTVKNIIDECRQFQASSLFPSNSSSPSTSSSQAGSILAQTPASLVDLYIAIYPVKFGEELTQSVQKGMLFSNSCLYLVHEIEEIRRSLAGSGAFEVLKDRLEESTKNLSILGESWYEQVIQIRCEKVDDILVDGAEGFRFTSDQDRYDECEMTINKVIQEIKRFAQQLKGILTKGKYYTAIGLVTEAALSRILQDVLALEDIPEVESHQLGELCRIFNSLEGLFSEDPTQPSFVVVYVPSWLKFNYLSELLEASLADISYLFEEGTLVDFEIDELIRLIKALFADSALRTNTINKVMAGHPVASA